MSNSENKAPKGPHLDYLLTAYVFENISREGKVEVERHLESCAECRAELEELRGTIARVNEALGRLLVAGGGAAEELVVDLGVAQQVPSRNSKVERKIGVTLY